MGVLRSSCCYSLRMGDEPDFTALVLTCHPKNQNRRTHRSWVPPKPCPSASSGLSGWTSIIVERSEPRRQSRTLIPRSCEPSKILPPLPQGRPLLRSLVLPGRVLAVHAACYTSTGRCRFLLDSEVAWNILCKCPAQKREQHAALQPLQNRTRGSSVRKP